MAIPNSEFRIPNFVLTVPSYQSPAEPGILERPNLKGNVMKQAIGIVLLVAVYGCSAGEPPEPPFAGDWEIWGSGTTASLRGLHVVDTEAAWASGSGGTVLRSLDGGLHWEVLTIPGAEDLDFRDVHAWDRNRALVLSAGLPARAYRTDDGGQTWRLTYNNETPGVFFNSMAFWDASRGIAVGDPINGRFLLISTDDGGESWTELPWESRPEALEGEANFAASGRCLAVYGPDRVWFGTGGSSARVFQSDDAGASWRVAATPLRSGLPSQGVFSVHILDERRGIAVGGDYLDEANPTASAAVTSDGGRTWEAATVLPSGFRECVVGASVSDPGVVISVGPTGTDVSEDGGVTWRAIAGGRFHTVHFVEARGVAVGVDGLAGLWLPPGAEGHRFD